MLIWNGRQACYYRELTLLILTRRIGETLMVGDNVTITVLSVKGNQVRIGVKAPPEVAVHREEIYKRIHEAETDNPSSKLDTSSETLENTIVQPINDESVSHDAGNDHTKTST